jgi:hypothetical protein
MVTRQRLRKLEQLLPVSSLAHLTDDELIERVLEIFTPEFVIAMKRLAATVKDVPVFVPGMNLNQVTDAQLCAMVLRNL